MLKNWGYPKGQKTYGYGGSIVPIMRCLSLKSVVYYNEDKLQEVFNCILNGKGSRIEEQGIFDISADLTLNSWLKKNLLQDHNGKFTNLHKTVANPIFLLLAYNQIRRNQGIETQGVDGRTFDGIKLKTFIHLGKLLHTGIYKPLPVKRIFIDRPNGKKRSLGIPSVIDKLLQQAIKMLLEYIYEPLFLESSHGFRLGKSCHTALNYYNLRFASVSWVISMDIKGCFDNIEHSRLVSMLSEEIKDKPFFDLIWKILRAGYIYNFKKFPSELGTPRGSIVGPIFCNIYLHSLDKFMETHITSFNKGKRKKANPVYTKILRSGKKNAALKCWKNKIQPLKTDDYSFRRLRYVRYVDDFIIGIDGAKEDACKIYKEVKNFLKKDLLFDLKENMKWLYHFRSEKVKYLGVYLKGTNLFYVPFIKRKDGQKVRSSLRPQILLPIGEIKSKLIELGFIKRVANQLRPTSLGRFIYHDLSRIIEYYNSIYRGFCGYYFICNNKALLSNIHYFLLYSCALTIARKMKLKTLKQVFTKYGPNLKILKSSNKRDFIQFVSADYWKIVTVNRNYMQFSVDDTIRKYTTFGSTISLFEKCYNCGSTEKLERHHVNKRRNIKTSDYLNFQKIVHIRRQVTLCSNCHHKLHKGIYNGKKL